MESGLITQPGHYLNLGLLSLGLECKHLKAENIFYFIFEN